MGRLSLHTKAETFLMTNRTRIERRKRLSKDEIARLETYLGISEATSNFIQSTNELLETFSSKDYQSFLKRRHLVHNRYRKLMKQTRLLADFFSQNIPEKILLDDEKLEEQVDLITAFELNHHYLGSKISLGKYHHDHLKDLADHLRDLESYLNEVCGPQIRFFTGKNDYELKLFRRDVLQNFLLHLYRLPVISENNDDVIALEIIFEAFGYIPQDIVKFLKRGTQDLRKSRKLEGKYKAKLV